MTLVPQKSSGPVAFPPQNAPSPEETFRTSINVFAKCVRSEWRGEKETGNRKRRGGEKEMRKREEGGEEMTEKSSRRRKEK